MSKIEPFPIYIPETDLAELEYRLTRVRLPERETDASQGIGLDR